MANKKNINICYFCSISSLNTGMPISTLKLIEHFSAIASVQTFCVFPTEGEFPRKARSFGANVTILPFFSLKKGLRALLPLLTWPISLFRLYYFLKKNNISIIHFSDFIDFPYYPAAFFARVRTIAHLRMCIENSLQRRFYTVWAKAFCTRVICISEAVKKYASLDSTICRVIYNPGPDPALFNPDRAYLKPLQYVNDKYNIITIANFRQVKGQEHFVKIASLLETRIPGKCHFIMIGDRLKAHQCYFAALSEQISNLNLNNCFSTIKNLPHDKIAGYIAHCAVLVHVPNYQEGFGGVILEAMMMGVPVVSFNSGGISECYTNNHSGYIVKQYDTEAAADAVFRLIQNPQIHRQMARNALNEIKKFSYEKHFNEVESIYKEII